MAVERCWIYESYKQKDRQDSHVCKLLGLVHKSDSKNGPVVPSSASERKRREELHPLLQLKLNP
jgi:hypothetical protein